MPTVHKTSGTPNRPGQTDPIEKLFSFSVRHLRGLAKIPFGPQIFDAILLTLTLLLKPQRVRGMEELEREILKNPDISLRIHRYGGTEFFHRTHGEIGHVHGHGLLDVRLSREKALPWLQTGLVHPHHVLPHTGWVSFRLESAESVPLARQLLDSVQKSFGPGTRNDPSNESDSPKPGA